MQVKRRAFNLDVKSITEIRLANLERLVKDAGTLEAVAVKADTSSVYLSQVRKRAIDRSTGRPRELGTRMARRLEAAYDKDHGWMDRDNDAEPDRQAVQGRTIADALSKLGPDARREALDFLRYKLERTTPHLASEDLARFERAIDDLNTEGDAS